MLKSNTEYPQMKTSVNDMSSIIKLLIVTEDLETNTYKISGVCKNWRPPKSCGYLNIRKKYKCPTRIPINSLMPLKR